MLAKKSQWLLVVSTFGAREAGVEAEAEADDAVIALLEILRLALLASLEEDFKFNKGMERNILCLVKHRREYFLDYLNG